VTAVATADPLVEYLDECGGKDVLLFRSDVQALEATRVMRERHPDVSFDCRYDKVFLKLKGDNAQEHDVQGARQAPR
jgi:hypothetical protein